MQFDVGMTPRPQTPQPVAEGMDLVAALMQQMLAVQREHLEHAKAVAAEHGARWRAMVGRWKQELPELPGACKEVLPVLERAYGDLINRLVDELRDQGDDALENDFALQEFLDRYGMRLGQLGHILNLVGPLADTAQQSESAPEKP